MFLTFVNMSTHRKKIAPKGDRLNWTPLKEVKPVKISALQIKGRVVSQFINATTASTILLVP